MQQVGFDRLLAFPGRPAWRRYGEDPGFLLQGFNLGYHKGKGSFKESNRVHVRDQIGFL